MAYPLAHQVVIITGASSGIGRALALQLAGQGAHLALAALDQGALDAVATLCAARGARAIAVPTDVAGQAQCARLVSRTVEAYGRLDALINNAGLSMWARFAEVSVTMVYPGFVATEVRTRAFGGDGRPLGASPVREAEVMSAEAYAAIILRAAARKREVVMTARGKLGLWLKLLAPGLVDRIARRAIEEGC